MPKKKITIGSSGRWRQYHKNIYFCQVGKWLCIHTLKHIKFEVPFLPIVSYISMIHLMQEFLEQRKSH